MDCSPWVRSVRWRSPLLSASKGGLSFSSSLDIQPVLHSTQISPSVNLSSGSRRTGDVASPLFQTCGAMTWSPIWKWRNIQSGNTCSRDRVPGRRAAGQKMQVRAPSIPTRGCISAASFRFRWSSKCLKRRPFCPLLAASQNEACTDNSLALPETSPFDHVPRSVYVTVGPLWGRRRCQNPPSAVCGSNVSPFALTQVQASIGFVPACKVSLHIRRRWFRRNAPSIRSDRRV